MPPLLEPPASPGEAMLSPLVLSIMLAMPDVPATPALLLLLPPLLLVSSGGMADEAAANALAFAAASADELVQVPGLAAALDASSSTLLPCWAAVSL